MSYNSRISVYKSRNYREQSCLSQCTACLAVVRYDPSLLPDSVRRDSLTKYVRTKLYSSDNDRIHVLFEFCSTQLIW